MPWFLLKRRYAACEGKLCFIDFIALIELPLYYSDKKKVYVLCSINKNVFPAQNREHNRYWYFKKWPKINEVENIQRKSKLFLLTNHSF